MTLENQTGRPVGTESERPDSPTLGRVSTPLVTDAVNVGAGGSQTGVENDSRGVYGSQSGGENNFTRTGSGASDSVVTKPIFYSPRPISELGIKKIEALLKD